MPGVMPYEKEGTMTRLAAANAQMAFEVAEQANAKQVPLHLLHFLYVGHFGD